MRLQPYGRVLPVHCCCEPTKRLGWVPVPASRMELDNATFAITIVAGRDAYDMWTGAKVPAPRIHTEVARLTLDDEHGQQTILAVKSADIPIETWRCIPGFIEDRDYANRRLVCLPALRPGGALRPGAAVRGEGVPAAGSERPGAAESEGARGHEAGAHADEETLTY